MSITKIYKNFILDKKEYLREIKSQGGLKDPITNNAYLQYWLGINPEWTVEAQRKLLVA